MIKLTDNIYIHAAEITAVTLTKDSDDRTQWIVAIFIRNRQDPFLYQPPAANGCNELKARECFNRIMNELDPMASMQ